MDVVIVRENEEDLYAGIEHRQTDDVVQCLKLISRQGCEKISRYAFEYARRNKRRKVTCFTKDNIMKLTDGLFHRVFEEVGEEYPDLEKEHWIVDIGAAKLADTPEEFDVLVLPNLYGDILSDVAAQIAGSVGLAGSANIGDRCAMFEAIHGSAPRRAGQNLANPSGLMLGAVLMLVHIGQPDVAERVHNAWLKTIEDGIHTYDVYTEGVSTRKVGTREFAQAVVERLGSRPAKLKPASYGEAAAPAAAAPLRERPRRDRVLVGVDVFVCFRGNVADLEKRLRSRPADGLELATISNRGIKVWPDGFPETMQTEHWQCRFLAAGATTHSAVAGLLAKASEAGLDFIKTENLYRFDGERGYSLGQGE
jgi:isocitrate dehydrogenase